MAEKMLIFGDPAFDRMLGTATATATVRDGAKTLLFALDRDTYDLDTPMQFAFGAVDKGAFETDPINSYTLEIYRTRQDKTDPLSLVVAGKPVTMSNPAKEHRNGDRRPTALCI